ncbi:BTAD domain-containing putative transcriptional regulator [Nocardiopsis changdeensis]|uniref:Winged helix-turn-helix domain-containing protein n=1 Tax=Nocardiopsis changdeensis TaxID=2831969 RepID=A0ABX8BK16_9ACTN|nr:MULTISPECIES: BTAD domain-containing putative transcriptional regulator [Nocardiopsis]QUX22347.1 winged helix-turn-helix domain-containing protein [Nocardiopsis changdeensis]QYX38288.1 winged helix-turn-helix domain-containing protein [Nocardiopsis sp. MT53]
MRFGVLGPLAVWTDEGTPVRVPEVKVRTLLTALLMEPGRVVSTDRLAHHLWGEAPPADPTNTLQTKVSQLRRALERAEPGGRGLVVRRPPGYALEVAADGVDAGRFSALVERARATADPRARAALLSEALDLWRGPAFADLPDTGSADAAAVRWEELRLTAVEDLARARLEVGEHAPAAEGLAEQVREHPLRERLRALHMLALYRSGRPAEALSSYADLRERLAGELGADPGPEVAELHLRILDQDPGLAGPAAALPPGRGGDLPVPPTALVGRAAELGRVTGLVDRHRLVTLTGPGGVGKTRLALAVAEARSADHPDGVWLVELAGLRPERESGAGPDAVAEEVGAVLGLRGRGTSETDPVARLCDALSARRALLLLDNCEHVVESAAGTVAALLRAAPGLRILATTREPLSVDGEVLESVDPLDLPGTGDGPDAALESDAVRLFAERAAAAAPGFRLTDDNAAAVVTLCRRLDGIPLALELAAARIRTLGAHGLLERIDDRFRLLAGRRRDAPARQRTLRAVIDWSWDLASEAERAVLRRLSVHAEGCTLEAAEAVCAGPGVAAEDVLDLLERLVERSLVVAVPDPDRPRFRLLETVGDYAAERLVEAGERDAARRAHAAYYTALAERADPHLTGRGQGRRLLLLDAETANLRAALHHSLELGDTETALRLALADTWHLFLRGRFGEALQRFAAVGARTPGTRTGSPSAREVRAAFSRAALELYVHGTAASGPVPSLPAAAVPDDPTGRAALARAVWFLGSAHMGFGDLGVAEDLVGRALRDARALGDTWVEAAALATRANIAHFRGDLPGLLNDGERSLALFDGLGDGWGRLQALDALAVHAEIRGDLERTAAVRREAVGVAEGLMLWSELARHLAGLGRVALLERDFDRADDFHGRSLRVAVEHGDPAGQEFAAIGLGMAARRRGDPAGAEGHLGPWLAWNLRLGAEPGAAFVLAELGFCAEQRGDAAQALDLHRRGLASALRVGDPRAVALALEGTAGALALGGDAERAASLLGTAAAARESLGAPLPEAERGDVDRIARRAAGALGEDAYEAAFARGRAVPLPSRVEEVG